MAGDDGGGGGGVVVVMFSLLVDAVESRTLGMWGWLTNLLLKFNPRLLIATIVAGVEERVGWRVGW